MTNYTPDFELFWQSYPKRWIRDLGIWVKRKKFPAFESWQKLTEEIRADCVAKRKLIKKHEGTPRDCVTWLNQRGWDDIDLPNEGERLPKDMTDSLKIVKFDEVSTSDKVNRERKKLGL